MGNFTSRMLNFRKKLAAHPRIRRTLYAAIILLAGLLFLQSEIASRAGADTVAKYVRGITFSLDSGRSESPAPPGSGPLDIRLGYTRIPAIVDSLERHGFNVQKQATVSSRFVALAERGFFPPYDERTQAGLTLLDHKGVLIAQHRFPAMVYDSVDAIPTPISQTLLFLENRELLDDRDPYQNPAIEWDRLVAAAANFAGARVLGSDQRFGASTLATQLEKLLHSRDGITRTPRDKAKQMVSATLRSYLHGPVTSDVRRRILLDYVNSLPLGAVPGYGEVIGVRDGFQRWFGLDPDSADWWLRTTGAVPSENAARAYRAAMMLLLGQRRPSYYLQSEKGRAALDSLTQSHLRLVEQTGVVPASLAQAARKVRTPLITTRVPPPRVPFIERKAINATRARLSDLVDSPGLYELDRYDLTAHTTFDDAAQDSATTLIRQLADREFIAANGLGAERLLGNADPGRVIYSLLLYERTPLGNAIRVQVDNLDRPFDLNQGARLELGSTAKLRTLVTYLEIVADLYASLTSTFADSSIDRRADDPISVWARDYLRDVPHSTLGSMLTAAMERRYSANSRESFFTGGGVHTFRNFDRTHENAIPTVTEGFRHSINLVFIRLMRDVVRYHMARSPNYSPTVLDYPDDPQRVPVLESYVDTEGRSAIERFARRHRGLSTDSSIAIILGRRATPYNWGRLVRAIDPAISDSALRAAVVRRYPANVPDDAELARLGRAVPSTLTLGDRAYVTSTDPLEPWVVGQFRHDLSRSIAQLQEDGAQARKEAYAWLFRQGASVQRAQDRAIQITLERDAFRPILTAWQRLGYPYANMVPSYGSSIGSSGDRPGALADLVSILVADGIRRPTVQLTALHFAQGTPYEVLLARDTAKVDTVMSAEVAAVVRSAMQDVVQNGTAVLLRDAVPGMPIGGKTGTGDNVARTFGAGGRLISTRTVSRTATFVFFLGDRFFGVSTAYVEGSDAERYSFTSGLPVRVVKLLLPSLAPLLGTDTLSTSTTNGSR